MEHNKDIQKLRISPVLACMSIGLVTQFSLGYHMTALNAPKSTFHNFVNETLFISNGTHDQVISSWSLVLSIRFAGIALGSIFSPIFLDKVGRTRSLASIAPPYVCAELLCAGSYFAQSYAMLTIGRFMNGFLQQILTTVVIVFIVEITETHQRGRLGIGKDLFMVLGQVIGIIVGQEAVLGSETTWFGLFLVSIPIGVGMLVLGILFPEPPRYLINKNDTKKAQRSFQIYSKDNSPISFETFVETIQSSSSGQLQKLSLKDLLFKQKELRMSLCLATLLGLATPACGGTVLPVYSVGLLHRAGFSLKVAGYIAIGFTLLLFPGLLVMVLLIDRLGRRILYIGLITTALVCQAGLFLLFRLYHYMGHLAFKVLGALLLAMLNTVTMSGIYSLNFVAAELLPQSARASGLALRSLVMFGVGAALTQMFDVIDEQFVGGGMLVLFLMALVTLSLIYAYLPETRHSTVEAAFEMTVRHK